MRSTGVKKSLRKQTTSSGNNRFDTLTNKQKRLVLHLLVEPDYNEAAKRMGVTKRSVYRLVANIRERLADYDRDVIEHIVRG